MAKRLAKISRKEGGSWVCRSLHELLADEPITFGKDAWKEETDPKPGIMVELDVVWKSSGMQALSARFYQGNPQQFLNS